MKNFYRIAMVIGYGACLFSCMKSETAQGGTVDGTENATAQTILVNSESENKYHFDFLPSTTTKQVIHHEYYSLSYNEEYEQAEWVAYELKRVYLKNNDFKRPYFIEDKKVGTASADWRNYKNSGFDKGHLCPAGDMEFNLNAYNDTFLTSNIAPQDHEFNAGVWNRLEQKVRYWAEKYDGVYVITGGVLESGLTTIGKEQVAVPR